ncbi:MAG: SMP-30/gluconolactonase/LRE family protein [Pseudomonadota bacterium]
MSDGLTGDLEQLATDLSFTEGPVWLAEHGCLLFTDIPGNAILRWSDADGLSTWMDNAHFAIGLTRDRSGRVLSCEHSTRSLSALDVGPDGALAGRTVLANAHDGRVLNSTNDVICTQDGTILFTDPPFGVRNLEGALHGYQQAQEIDGAFVFAVGATPDAPLPVVTDIYRPNGLCLSPDETTLYVSDSSETHHKVIAMDFRNAIASSPRDFAVMPVGVPDGLRVDAEGRLWVAGGDGVYVYDKTGDQVAHLPVPEMVTNIEFGGPDLSQLFITATTSLYRVSTTTRSGRAW